MLATLAVCATAPRVSAQLPDTGNAFANVSSRTLPNGLKVWVRPFVGDRSVDVMLVVAGGASLDPVGKEELAHFAEHIVFGDRPGLTEQALNAQVESLGGKISANTSYDRTMFRLTIPAEHAPEAIRWMARLVAPRDVSPTLVAQQLPPILLELGAAPRSVSERLRRWVVDPPWPRRPSLWKWDFGLAPLPDRDYDPYRSLHRLTSVDVQEVLRRTYVASNMTLVVAGGIDRDEVLLAVDSAFASFASHPPPALVQGTLRGRERSPTIWTLSRDATYVHFLRGVSLNARERVRALFLRDFLHKRLDDRLRYGEAKLVYHPTVVQSMLGNATILTVMARSDAGAARQVQRVVTDEIERLRRGDAADSAFLADRRSIAGRARMGALGREALIDGVRSHFFATAPGESLPDVVAIQDSVTPAELAALLRDHFPANGESSRTLRPLPVPRTVVALAAALLAWCTVLLLRRRLIVPVRMPQLRYVARVRIDWPVAILLLVVWGALAFAARLALAGARAFLEAVIFPLPGRLQLASYVVALVALVAIVTLALSRIPRKVLVFNDHLRLKYLAYRSVVIPASDIVECRLAAFGEGWTLAGFVRGWALTLGLGGGALLIRLQDGRTLLLRTRATAELREVMRDAWQLPHGPA